ncbi:MAG: hypothetical protein KIT74_01660 [Fimbriimonadales bacterium]|nr:hypothetical protein [Fimbriimonadales bacterium]
MTPIIRSRRAIIDRLSKEKTLRSLFGGDIEIRRPIKPAKLLEAPEGDRGIVYYDPNMHVSSFAHVLSGKNTILVKTNRNGELESKVWMRPDGALLLIGSAGATYAMSDRNRKGDVVAYFDPAGNLLGEARGSDRDSMVEYRDAEGRSLGFAIAGPREALVMDAQRRVVKRATSGTVPGKWLALEDAWDRFIA